mmetsp:Transcript_70243/g.110986  ORF Transcript_70243/g.110986 Transcript_70243/m.110986 type:complete len:93 (-) Transcript_70243:123-401(-)
MRPMIVIIVKTITTMPMLFHSVIPSTCIMSRCLTDLKIRKTRAKRRIRKNDAAGKKCPNIRSHHHGRTAKRSMRLDDSLKTFVKRSQRDIGR